MSGDDLIAVLFLFFFLVVLPGAVLFIAIKIILRWHRRRLETAAWARQTAEARLLDLAMEFPGATDDQCAVLFHDELVNHRANPALFAWANAATVGRLRRTVVVQAVRAAR